MSYRASIAGGLSLVLVAAGCVAAARGPGGAADGDGATVVSLERGACYRSCPEYRLELHSDGRVVFEGRGGDVLRGRHEGRVEPREVQRLAERMRSADFFAQPSEYVEGSASCGAYADDAPTVVLGLRTAERAHSVRHDHGCSEAPGLLSALEQAVDSVGGVGRWVPSKSGARE